MKKLLLVCTLLTLMLGGCKWVTTLFDYSAKAKDFTNSLNHNDYEHCLSLIDMDLMRENNIPKDTLLAELKLSNELISHNFGKVEYSSPSVEQKASWSNKEGSNHSYPKASISFDNGKEYGIVDITFDDSSKKIRYFQLRDFKRPVPDLTLFWVFMVLGIINAGFIIYVVRKVKRSNSETKKRKYALAILLNVPTLTFNAASGLSLSLFQIQLLFGSSFAKIGYINASWDLALPLGAIIVLYLLRREKRRAERAAEAAVEYTRESFAQHTDHNSPTEAPPSADESIS